MFSATDHSHMARALRLAERGCYSAHPNPRVGSVVAHGDEIVGQGWHRRAGEPHAEALALDDAAGQARGATLYVTLEPCCHTGRTPPCTGAIVDAGIARVVAAMRDPDPRMAGAGLAALERAGIAVQCGLMQAQARRLNAGFASRMERARPLVRVKLAMSLDGRTALANGASQWITGPEARRDVQHWRACSDAVVTGIGTVLADDPGLDVRPGEMGARARLLGEPVRQPLRVVMDSRLRTPSRARLLARPGPVMLVTASPPSARRRASLPPSCEVVVVEADADRPRPAALMSTLARRGVNEVLVEAGPTLAGAFVAADLADELIVYLAPTLLGPGARPLLALPELARMCEQRRLDLHELRAVGRDLRLRFRVTGSGVEG